MARRRVSARRSFGSNRGAALAGLAKGRWWRVCRVSLSVGAASPRSRPVGAGIGRCRRRSGAGLSRPSGSAPLRVAVTERHAVRRRRGRSVKRRCCSRRRSTGLEASLGPTQPRKAHGALSPPFPGGSGRRRHLPQPLRDVACAGSRAPDFIAHARVHGARREATAGLGRRSVDAVGRPPFLRCGERRTALSKARTRGFSALGRCAGAGVLRADQVAAPPASRRIGFARLAVSAGAYDDRLVARSARGRAR